MELLQTPATISKIQTMSHRSLRFQIDTQENLSDEEMGKFTSLHEKFGHFCFMPDSKITEDQILNLPPLPDRPEDKKSPAQALRGVLYVYWDQRGKQGDFETFYRGYIDNIVIKIKEKLT